MAHSRTAIMNTRTDSKHPDDQQPTDYSVTPPEVQAYLSGETLPAEDMALVRNWYIENNRAMPPQRAVEAQQAFAAPYGHTEGASSIEPDPYNPPVPRPSRVLRKGGDKDCPTLVDVAQGLVACLSSSEQEFLLTALAKKLGYFVDG